MGKQKFIGLRVRILGEDKSIKTLRDLEDAAKQLRNQLKDADEAQFGELQEELARVNTQIKAVRKETRELEKDFKAQTFAEGSYDQLNDQLRKARRSFKELSQAEREGKIGQALLANIQKLDTELKEIDGTIGQFQRNVGNYSSALDGVGSSIKNIFSLTAGIAGISLAFDQLGDALQYATEQTDEIVRLRSEIQKLTGTTAEGAEQAAIQVRALAETFDVSTEEISTGANELVQQFGLSLPDALATFEKGLLGAANASDFIGETREELRKLADIGLSADSALALIVQASNRNINVDVIAEPLIRLRERTQATQDAIEAAFGKDGAQKVFEQFEQSPIKAIAAVSDRLGELDSRSEAAGMVLADVFSSAGEDAITFAKNISSLTTDLDSLINTEDELTKRQIAQIDAQQKLQTAYSELTNEISGAGSALDIAKTQGETFLVNVLLRLVEAFKPVIDQIQQFRNRYKEATDGLSFGETVLNAVSRSFDRFAGIVEFLVLFFGDLISAGAGLLKTIKPLGDAFDFVVDLIVKQQEQIANLPSAYEAFKAAAVQAFQNVSQSLSEFVTKGEILFKKFRRALSFGKDTRIRLSKEIRTLEADLEKQSAVAGKSIGDAYAEAYAESVKERLAAKEKQESVFTPVVKNAEAEGEKAGEAFGQGFGKARPSFTPRLQGSNEPIEGEALPTASTEQLQKQTDLYLAQLTLVATKAREIGQITEQEFQDKLIEIQRLGLQTRLAFLEEGSEEAIQIQTQLSELEIQNTQRTEEEKDAIREEFAQKEANRKENLINGISQGFQALASFADTVTNRIFSEQLARLEKRKEKEIELANESEEERVKIEEKFAAKQLKIERRQRAAQKALALTQAGIDIAIATIRALATPPIVPNIPAATATGVLGGIQLATIAAAKFALGGMLPEKGKGGEIKGRRHAQGGVLVGLSEVEGGEGILTRGAMQDPLLRSAASAINVAGGGVPFDGASVLGSPLVIAPPRQRGFSSQGNSLVLDWIRATNERIDRLVVINDVEKTTVEQSKNAETRITQQI